MTGLALLSILTTPVSCNGVTQIVETTQNSGESTSDFQARHLAAVADARTGCTGTFTAAPSTYTTPVDCNGSIGDVITMQSPGQSLAEFFAVHNNAVRIAVNDCP